MSKPCTAENEKLITFYRAYINKIKDRSGKFEQSAYGTADRINNSDQRNESWRSGELHYFSRPNRELYSSLPYVEAA